MQAVPDPKGCTQRRGMSSSRIEMHTRAQWPRIHKHKHKRKNRSSQAEAILARQRHAPTNKKGPAEATEPFLLYVEWSVTTPFIARHGDVAR